MEKHILEKPYIYSDNWLAFPNSIVSNVQLADCDNTISGRCFGQKSLKECSDICFDNSDCNYFYHIKGDGHNICVPVHSPEGTDNPLYFLRNKKKFPVLEDMDVTTVVNTDVFTFPPEEGNNVFFLDNLFLYNVGTQTSLSMSTYEPDKPIYFKKTAIELCYVSPPPTKGENFRAERYIPLIYGSHMTIGNAGTVLYMTNKSINNRITWGMGEESVKLHLEPFSPSKKKGDNVAFSDQFYIYLGDTNVLSVDDGILTMIDSKNKRENAVFKFQSQVKQYYCSGNKCLPIPADETIASGETGIYKGYPIDRDPNCWGLCPKQKHRPCDYIVPIILIILIIIVLIEIIRLEKVE